jgi:hypothetical protein
VKEKELNLVELVSVSEELLVISCSSAEIIYKCTVFVKRCE